MAYLTLKFFCLLNYAGFSEYFRLVNAAYIGYGKLVKRLKGQERFLFQKYKM